MELFTQKAADRSTRQAYETFWVNVGIGSEPASVHGEFFLLLQVRL